MKFLIILTIIVMSILAFAAGWNSYSYVSDQPSLKPIVKTIIEECNGDIKIVPKVENEKCEPYYEPEVVFSDCSKYIYDFSVLKNDTDKQIADLDVEIELLELAQKTNENLFQECLTQKAQCERNFKELQYTFKDQMQMCK